MKKLFVLAVFFIAAMFSAQSQSAQLNVKKGERGLYLDHTVAAREGLYSIGRMYNVHPKFIASYNHIDMNKGLNIDQVIHIPLTDTNFNQKTNKGIPIYYIVGSSDGLQKISNFNNKVSLQNLRTWNNIKGDNINAGAKLIIGYLNSKDMNLANLAKQPEKEIAKEKPQEKPQPKEPAEEEKPLVKQTEPVKEVKPEQKAETTVAPVAVQKENKQVKEEPRSTDKEVAKEKPSASEGQGYFKPFFEQQVKSYPASKNETMTAGIFKTSSGWQDAKYYLLIDGVSTGSIVRLINPENNKSVYAKVLGEMNGIRQNQGLGVRISNAAAAALGIESTEKFIVNVNY